MYLYYVRLLGSHGYGLSTVVKTSVLKKDDILRRLKETKKIRGEINIYSFVIC